MSPSEKIEDYLRKWQRLGNCRRGDWSWCLAFIQIQRMGDPHSTIACAKSLGVTQSNREYSLRQVPSIERFCFELADFFVKQLLPSGLEEKHERKCSKATFDALVFELIGSPSKELEMVDPETLLRPLAVLLGELGEKDLKIYEFNLQSPKPRLIFRKPGRFEVIEHDRPLCGMDYLIYGSEEAYILSVDGSD